MRYGGREEKRTVVTLVSLEPIQAHAGGRDHSADHTDNGLAIIFTTRQPNIAGVSGKGILLNLIVRHLTSAPATLQVTEAGLRNSRQRMIPVNVEHGSVSVE